MFWVILWYEIFIVIFDFCKFDKWYVLFLWCLRLYLEYVLKFFIFFCFIFMKWYFIDDLVLENEGDGCDIFLIILSESNLNNEVGDISSSGDKDV